MKLTKSELKRIIKEELLKEMKSSDISFGWDASGLTMIMSVNGNEALSFSDQQEVTNLIGQLEGLLAGPMRTSP